LAEDEHRAIYKRCDPKKGDVLLVKDGVNTGDAAVNTLDEEFSLLSIVCLLRPRPELLFNQFLRYYLLSPVGYRMLTGQMTGTAIKRIILGRIKESPVPIAPLDEQRTIVAEIEKQFSRLDEAVANLKRVRSNLKRYKAAVLKAAVEGKLTEDWRKEHSNVEPASKLLERILVERREKWKGKGTYKEPIAPDTSDLSPVPQGWTWASVDQVAEVLLGKMLDQNKHRTGRRLPYLRNINVRWDRVQTDDLLEMFFESDELDRYGLKPGDVLVCEGGEPGRAAVWDGRIPDLKYQKALHRVRFYGTIEPRYLVFLLEFLADTGRFERWFTGSTIKHFTRESFISLPIQMPSLKEQEQIVAEVERRLSVIDELEATVKANLTRADRLRQSILSQAFSGRLSMAKQ
jgi:type I restriction enzyme, S subunit